MNDGIGPFIRARREELRLSQTAVADAVQMRKSHLSEIERGKIGLPNADVRRRLAKVLGVTQVDILIAAGELTPDELQEAGKTGVVESTPAVEELIAFIRSLHWDQSDINRLRGIVDLLFANARVND
jgi:transcriptional regulator with XRE-family HTH domain